MNPKEMTNEQLLDTVQAAIGNEQFDYPVTNRAVCEIERRLNESAALRKENEELRKDEERIDFLDDGNYGVDPRNIPGVRMDGRRFHCLAGRGDWNTLREAIDAARLAKESEAATHEPPSQTEKE